MLNRRFIDWIWHIRGSVVLAPGQSSNEAFDRLEPLFHARGTSHDRSGDMLTFEKKDQAPQDKMSIFDDGVLQIKQGVAGSVLHYSLKSRMLLFCFLAPLLFIGFAQLTIALGKLEKPPVEAPKPDKKDVALPQNPIDKFLGAPAPEKPKDGEGQGKKPSATPAYVLAAIFALLYVVGRILEDRLMKGLFRKSLLGPQSYATQSTA